MEPVFQHTSILGYGRRNDAIALTLVVCLSAAFGFFVCGLVRVREFGAPVSWSLLWRCVRVVALCGAVPGGWVLGAVVLRRELRRGLAAVRQRAGVCQVCCYRIGVQGLVCCPECGHRLDGPAWAGLSRIRPGPAAVVVLLLVLAALVGGAVSNGLIGLDERAFLAEVSAQPPLAGRPYHRARAWPFSGHGMTYLRGELTLTD